MRVEQAKCRPLKRLDAETRLSIKRDAEKLTLGQLTKKYGITRNTARRWRDIDKRTKKQLGRPTSLSKEQQKMLLTYRERTRSSLDEMLEIFQDPLPHLTRTTLYRVLRKQPLRIKRSKEITHTDFDTGRKGKLGFFAIVIAERLDNYIDQRTYYLFVAVDMLTGYHFKKSYLAKGRQQLADFMRAFTSASPYRIRAILTDGSDLFWDYDIGYQKLNSFEKLCRSKHIEIFHRPHEFSIVRDSMVPLSDRDLHEVLPASTVRHQRARRRKGK